MSKCPRIDRGPSRLSRDWRYQLSGLSRPRRAVRPARTSPPEAVVGQECVVKTVAGDRLIRTLLLGSHVGVYALVGFNTPPLADIEIIEASPIRWIKRGD